MHVAGHEITQVDIIFLAPQEQPVGHRLTLGKSKVLSRREDLQG